jgi:hypothetical protein
VSKAIEPKCFRNSVIVWSGPGLFLVFKEATLNVTPLSKLSVYRYACNKIIPGTSQPRQMIWKSNNSIRLKF